MMRNRSGLIITGDHGHAWKKPRHSSRISLQSGMTVIVTETPAKDLTATIWRNTM